MHNLHFITVAARNCNEAVEFTNQRGEITDSVAAFFLIADDYLIKNLAPDSNHKFNWIDVELTQLVPSANHVVLVDFHS
ncbi:MAG: hypothetical protein KBD25_00850 [Rickettsiaceae bacterium]|nr:hypothetical protein [Rickettsiaceae bacterium]